MGLYAFFRLTWRPAFALLLPMTTAFVVMLFVTTLNWDLERTLQLDLSMLAIPLMLGMLVGQTVYDVRTRSFSWVLPGFQRKMALSVLALGLLSALSWSAAYGGLGGEMHASVGFSGFLLVYMAFAALQPSVVACWLAMLVAVIGSVRLFELMRAEPIACTALALLGAASCFYGGFGRGSARKLLQVAPALMGVNLLNRIEVARAGEDALTRTGRTRPWRLATIGTKLRDWVRAVEYGSLGAATRWRTGLVTFASFAFLGLCMTSVGFADETRSFESGLERAFHILFVPPVPLENPIIMPLALFPGIWAAAYVFGSSTGFQRGWVYPLSRDQRARIVYRMSLRQNLLILTLLSLTFVGYGGLIVLLRGGVDDLGFMPGYFRGVIAIGILLPLIQRFRLWTVQPSGKGASAVYSTLWSAFGTAVFAGLAELVTQLWSYLFLEVALSIQVALIIALALTSQVLFLRSSAKLHRRANLI